MSEWRPDRLVATKRNSIDRLQVWDVVIIHIVWQQGLLHIMLQQNGLAACSSDHSPLSAGA